MKDQILFSLQFYGFMKAIIYSYFCSTNFEIRWLSRTFNFSDFSSFRNRKISFFFETCTPKRNIYQSFSSAIARYQSNLISETDNSVFICIRPKIYFDRLVFLLYVKKTRKILKNEALQKTPKFTKYRKKLRENNFI